MKQLEKVGFVGRVLNALHADNNSLLGLSPSDSLCVFGKSNSQPHVYSYNNYYVYCGSTGNIVYMSSLHIEVCVCCTMFNSFKTFVYPGC